MVVIRLARTGAKKRPFYNLVVADVRTPRDGRFIERIGFYNPVAHGKETTLRMNLEAYNTWITKGAKPTNRVKALYKMSVKNDGNDVQARFEKTRKIPSDIAKSVKPKPPIAEELAEK